MADEPFPNQAQPEINELINRVLAGHPEEFKGLVRRYQAKIYGMALNSSQHLETAAELCQGVFLTTYERLRRFDQTGSFTNWILRIATRRCSEFLRAARGSSSPLAKVRKDSLPDLLDVSLDDRRRQPVLKAFHNLDEETRTVIWLYYFFDRSPNQIADILEFPIPQVEERLLQARRIIGRTSDKAGGRLESGDGGREALVEAQHGEEIYRSMLVKPSPDFTDRILSAIKNRPILPPEQVAVVSRIATSPGLFSRPGPWLGSLGLVGGIILAMAIWSSNSPEVHSPGTAGPSSGMIASQARIPVAAIASEASTTVGMTAGQISPNVRAITTQASTAASPSSAVAVPVAAGPAVAPAGTAGTDGVVEIAAPPGTQVASASAKAAEDIGRVMRVAGTWEGNPGLKPRFFSSGASFSTGPDGRIELSVTRWGSLFLGSSSACIVERDGMRLSSGSAWFAIASHPSASPFRVRCNGHSFEVIGTRFGVTTLPEKSARVSLFEGTLWLTGSNGDTGELAAGNGARLDESGIHRSGLTQADLQIWQAVSGDPTLALPLPSAGPASAPVKAPTGTATPDPNEPGDFIRYLQQQARDGDT